VTGLCSPRGFERVQVGDHPPTTRASDTERDEVVRTLAQHHVDGRLSTDEFGERAARATDATTLGELEQTLVDLPSLPRTNRRPSVAGRLVPILAVAAFVTAVVVTHGRAVFGLLWIAVVLSVLRTRGPWRRPNHRRYAAS